jgi:hypothetical protein
MQLTNHSNLPEAVVQAVKNDEYSRGDSDISITSLLLPPRLRVLRDRNDDKITEDVSERLYSLQGRMIHGILEKAAITDLSEQRLYMDVLGWKVSGQTDNYVFDSGRLSDYKYQTVWRFIDGLPEEMIAQTNLYAHIFQSNGLPVNSLDIIAMFRDWSKLEARRNRDYPQLPIQTYAVPLWSHEQRQEFLEARVRLHQEAATQEMPEVCSPEERWQRPEKFALMKLGNRRASKLFNTKEEADNALQGMKKLSDYFVERRPPEDLRCMNYCSAAPFCPYYLENYGPR